MPSHNLIIEKSVYFLTINMSPMKPKIIIILFLSFVLGQTIQGQNNNRANVPASIQDLNTPNDRLNIINEQFVGRATDISNIDDNTVLIVQAGVNNESTVTTEATNSLVILRQNGVDNSMQLDLRATTIDYQATQSGNNNLLLDFSNGPITQLLQRKIIQTGSNQNLVIHGNNALSDKMEIRMNNSGQSIIIRNTN